LFCPEERVNRLERSLQGHSLEFEYVGSRIVDAGAGGGVVFCSGSV